MIHRKIPVRGNVPTPAASPPLASHGHPRAPVKVARNVAVAAGHPVTLAQLLEFQRQHNQDRVMRAGLCTIAKVQPVTTQRGFPAYIYTVREPVAGSGRMHRVDVSSRNPANPSVTTQPFVSCSCEDFCFRCEWALANFWDMSFIRYGNGDPSDEKNPEHLPYVCKHLIAAISHLLGAVR